MPKLIEPALRHQQAYLTYLEQWRDEPVIVPSTMDPGIGAGQTDYAAFLARLEREKDPFQCPPGLVPATFFLWMDDRETTVYGALQLRHYLNESLRRYAGHIGYGVSPVHRGHGVAAQMLQAVLPVALGLGNHRVLLGCKSSNTASARTIERCGGILEAEWEEDGIYRRRYWIDLP